VDLKSQWDVVKVVTPEFGTCLEMECMYLGHANFALQMKIFRCCLDFGFFLCHVGNWDT